MSKDEDEDGKRWLDPKCYETADLILKTLRESTNSPAEAIVVLAMAHVKLWTQYGDDKDDATVSMLASYLANFFALDNAVRKALPGEMLH